ncbi:hypothetical protein [Paenibacillus koleovorans]|uniref:hypothetical protein n=1 Tax=Paenibacillus koleovorans TaxID=121608 RepID=UPI000FD877B0|nr:hypothetical protein [Paenibacillus koleovorans]
MQNASALEGNEQKRLPASVETQADVGLLYDNNLAGEQPSALVIKLKNGITDTGRTYFAIQTTLPKVDAYDFGYLVTVPIQNSEVIWTDIPFCFGVDIPRIRGRIGPLEVDQLLIKLDALDYSLQSAIMRSNPQNLSSF